MYVIEAVPQLERFFAVEIFSAENDPSPETCLAPFTQVSGLKELPEGIFLTAHSNLGVTSFPLF